MKGEKKTLIELHKFYTLFVLHTNIYDKSYLFTFFIIINFFYLIDKEIFLNTFLFFIF